MRRAIVYINNTEAGKLVRNEDGYIFKYFDEYIKDSRKFSISVTLPKTIQEHASPVLFPFFAGLLSQGENRRIQERGIDNFDDFTLLLRTANTDTIGAITVKPA